MDLLGASMTPEERFILVRDLIERALELGHVTSGHKKLAAYIRGLAKGCTSVEQQELIGVFCE